MLQTPGLFINFASKVALVSAAILGTVPASATEPLAIEKGFKQLFLDDAPIEHQECLTRVMHRPKKHGAVLRPDGKADGTRVQSGSAPVWVPEEKVYKIFYMGFPYAAGKGQWILDEIGPAMAVSKDGLNWERPNLDKVKFRGSKDNNRFYVVDPNLRWGSNRFVEVIYTPHDPDPLRRYKGFLGAMGRRPVVSPDGINWKLVKTPPIPSSDTSTLIWDELGKRYVAVVKSGTKYGRSASVTFSKDFVTWTKSRLTFCTDQQDQVIAKKRIASRLADPDMQNPMFNYPEPKEPWSPDKACKHSGPIDGEDFNQTGKGKNFNIPTWRAETYKMGVFPYEGLYMGVVMFYYPTGPAVPAWNNTVGFDEFQLIFTRDGQMNKENWKRLGNREPFLETSPLSKGLVGNFDRQQMGVFNRPLVMGNELWFYYVGLKFRTPHYKMWPDGKVRNQANLTPKEKADFEDGCSAICLAKLRLDGFVSLEAGKKPGELLTKPFKADGKDLFLNVDNRKGGKTKVEVLDVQSHPIDGFSLDNSVALNGNGVSQNVSWQDGAKWSTLKGRKVRLRIVMHDAGLYAFWTK
ncbi:MAG: hypothetical protein JXM70_22920 [Pirellulales bacterium]|nr:hypothetical protein [Pirellulales bacterium]